MLIYTDGSCIGNPGPGGWGVIIRSGSEEYELGGREAHTTNNRMEMMAIIRALEWVAKQKSSPQKVEIRSDSNLVIQTLTKGWKRKMNTDLWLQIDRLLEKLAPKTGIKWTWVKGHHRDPLNNRVDVIAQKQARS